MSEGRQSLQSKMPAALYFPDEETLALAISGGEIPEPLAKQPVSARLPDDGPIIVRLDDTLPDEVIRRLERLGVRHDVAPASAEFMSFRCWPQLLALKPVPTAAARAGDSSTILFEVRDPSKLPEVVHEMLRLGNDRQSYRFVQRPDGTAIAFLKVVSPPYYSLLRAFEPGDESHGIVAYEPIADRVWIQCGYTYPLRELLRAPAAELLLRYPTRWHVVEWGEYRDIYDLIEFTVPPPPQWREASQACAPIRIPLRLYRDENPQPAELWVVDTDALAQLEQLYCTLDESTRSRLLVAVSHRDGRDLAVIRSRPSREPPPVLEIAAEGYRRLMSSHPIYVPCGTRLQPSIRESRLVELLGAGNDRVVWLRPCGSSDFRPESLPDASFQPLESLGEIVIARSHEALQEWIASTVFEFREFECPDEDTLSQPREDASRKTKGESTKDGVEGSRPAAKAERLNVKKVRAKPKAPKPLPSIEPQQVSPSRANAVELEKRFLAMPHDFDDPARLAIWVELARSYDAQGRHESALMCWTSAVWIAGSHYRQVVRQWHIDTGKSLRSDFLDAWAAGNQPNAELLHRAVVLCLASEFDEELLPLVQLGKATEFLLSQVERLPARAVWLVATAIARRSGGNDLLLTRIRDRLLPRWQRSGLPVLQNLPPFLRYCGNQPGEQGRGYHAFLHRLPETVARWVQRGAYRSPQFQCDATVGFALAMLAVACRRLHEDPLAFELWDLAAERISTAGEADIPHGRLVYGILLNALRYRFDEAAEQQPPTRSLPAEMLDEINQLDRMPRYLVDQFRTRLDSIEPGKRIDPYRSWMARYVSSLERELAEFPDITDPAVLESRIDDLLSSGPDAESKTPELRGKIVCAALESASLLSESRCISLFEEALALVENVEDTRLRFALCEKAILAAGHFGYKKWTQVFVELFLDHLKRQRHTTELWSCLTSTTANTLHALRKLGLEHDLSLLVQRLLEFVGRRQEDESRTRTEHLRSLLTVAGGLFHAGDSARALPIIEAARGALFQGGQQPKRRTSLAVAYVTALADAPAELAVAALEELLEELEEIESALTTNDYFGLAHLEVADAIARSVTSEALAIGQKARQWLEEMEADLRRRMHEAAAAAVKPA